MGRRIQLRDLISDRLLQEIHHFLWIDPSFAGEVVDAGWSCRDHAWLTALLAQSLGYKAALFHGEAFFVKARTKKSGSLGYFQRPHSWVVVEGVGAIDLSIKPDFSSSGDHFRIPVRCIFADECIPRGKSRAFFFDQTGAFNRAVERPGQFGNQDTAFYLIKEAEEFHSGHVQFAAGWIGSPLTVLLDAVYGNPSALYAALLMHIRDFLEGRVPSLTCLPREEAWHQLADMREVAIDRTRQCIGLMETPPLPPVDTASFPVRQTKKLKGSATRP